MNYRNNNVAIFNEIWWDRDVRLGVGQAGLLWLQPLSSLLLADLPEGSRQASCR